MCEGCVFTTTDIKHFAWCEAIIYVKYVLGFRERVTEYMEYGDEVEKEKHIVSAMKKFGGSYVIKHPLLIDESLGLTGIPDYVIITRHGEGIPLEIKWAEPSRGGRPKRDHIMQLSAYALLIERTWRSLIKPSVKRGAIYYLRPEGRLIEVSISYDMKLQVMKALKTINEIASGIREPRPKRSKCPSCGYARHCPYASNQSNK